VFLSVQSQDSSLRSHFGGWAQYTILDGARSSSADSYLGPGFIDRPGLNVLLNARVGRILKSGDEGGKPVFGTVEFKSGGSSTAIITEKNY
jgi:choline dehydrogenase-like flavoprotein